MPETKSRSANCGGKEAGDAGDRLAVERLRTRAARRFEKLTGKAWTTRLETDVRGSVLGQGIGDGGRVVLAVERETCLTLLAAFKSARGAIERRPRPLAGPPPPPPPPAGPPPHHPDPLRDKLQAARLKWTLDNLRRCAEGAGDSAFRRWVRDRLVPFLDANAFQLRQFDEASHETNERSELLDNVDALDLGGARLTPTVLACVSILTIDASRPRDFAAALKYERDRIKAMQRTRRNRDRGSVAT